MKKTSLTEKTPAELTRMLGEKREELRMLRFSSAGSRPKDAAMPYKTRKEIARLITAIHAKTVLAKKSA